MAAYANAAAGTDMAQLLAEAKKAAGPEIINATMTIPIILSVAFAVLYFIMRGKQKEVLVG